MPSPDTSLLDSAKSTDRSVGFFNDIFGLNWENTLNGTAPSGEFGNVLIEMFFAFNAIVLAGVAILLFYVISVGVVGTAHEGEALGKRYSTLWTPIRSALSISFLMPLPWVKLSLLQALVLKFIFFSIGGASYLASDTVKFMAKQGGAMTLTTAPLMKGAGLADEILRNLLVQEYYSSQEGLRYAAPGYIEGNTVTDGLLTKKTLTFNPIGDVNGENMGTLGASCNTNQVSVCDNEIALVRTLITNLRPIATQLGQKPTGDELGIYELEKAYSQAIKTYAAQSQANATSALSVVDDGRQAKLTKITESIENNGWVWLGAYYVGMSKVNEEAHLIANSRATVSKPMDFATVASKSGKEIQPSALKLETFLNSVQAGQQADIASSGTPDDAVGIFDLLGGVFSDAVGSSFSSNNSSQTGAAHIIHNTISDGDPILKLQGVGHELINTGSKLVSFIAGVAIGKGLYDVFKNTAGGWLANLGSKATGLDALLEKGLSLIMALMTPLILALMFAGITLAYYLPTLPFIIWTSSVVGWLILTMEIMVAAPIWAAMHAIPEGEGMAGQHGRQGYMLFFGILFRPALHVIGFFMAFMVTATIAHFVGDSFGAFIELSGGNESPIGIPAQIISWLATLIIGTAIVVVSTHKAFHLITWLPDNLLRWAGNGTPSLGEHGDEGKTNTMFVAAINRMQSAAGGGISAATRKLSDAGGQAVGGTGGGEEKQAKDAALNKKLSTASSHHTQGDVGSKS